MAHACDFRPLANQIGHVHHRNLHFIPRQFAASTRAEKEPRRGDRGSGGSRPGGGGRRGIEKLIATATTITALRSHSRNPKSATGFLRHCNTIHIGLRRHTQATFLQSKPYCPQFHRRLTNRRIKGICRPWGSKTSMKLIKVPNSNASPVIGARRARAPGAVHSFATGPPRTDRLAGAPGNCLPLPHIAGFHEI